MNKVKIKVLDYNVNNTDLIVEFTYPDYPDLNINNTKLSFQVYNLGMLTLDDILKMVAKSGLSLLQQELFKIQIESDTVLATELTNIVGQSYVYTDADVGEVPE